MTRNRRHFSSLRVACSIRIGTKQVALQVDFFQDVTRALRFE